MSSVWEKWEECDLATGAVLRSGHIVHCCNFEAHITKTGEEEFRILELNGEIVIECLECGNTYPLPDQVKSVE